MGYPRLFLADLSDYHLTEMQRAVESGVGASMERWLEDMADGRLEVYDLGAGLIGLYPGEKILYIAFVVGRGLYPRIAREALDWMKQMANGRSIDCTTKSPTLSKMYARLGFTVFAVSMRI